MDLLPKQSIGVEIGVFKGQFADQILERVSPKSFYLIDPWVGKIHSGDKDGKTIEFIDDGEIYYQNEILSRYGKDERVKVIRNTSGILRTFEDDFFDWAYVDGNHSYLGVSHDLEILRTKVKRGGVIMGHDYKVPRYYSVVKAVNDFCRKYNLKIDYITADGFPSYYIKNF